MKKVTTSQTRQLLGRWSKAFKGQTDLPDDMRQLISETDQTLARMGKGKAPAKPREYGHARAQYSHSRQTWIEAEELAYTYHGSQLRRCLAVCADGQKRIVYAGIADTFFSIPAHATIAGTYTSGYVSIGDQFDGPAFEGEYIYKTRQTGEG